ncbi:maker239, partial [Drosophila busckii]
MFAIAIIFFISLGTPVKSISKLNTVVDDCGCTFSYSKYNEVVANCSSSENSDYSCVRTQEPVYLSLQYQNFTEIPTALYRIPFNSLKQLDLSRNKIQHIPQDFLKFFPNISNLTLTYNHLTDPYELMHIREYVITHLAYNKFNCDCKDSRLPTLRKHMPKLHTSVICATDDPGKPVESLTVHCHEILSVENNWTPLIIIIIISISIIAAI